MKRIILTAFAAAALLTGCNRDEIVETNPQNAITFENAFVDNATRATEVTKDNLTEFYVHGVRKDGTGKVFNVFNNTRVYREGEAPANYVYKYDDPRYWFDSDYEFLACNLSTANTEAPQVKLLPGANGLLSSGTLDYEQMDPDTDLITAFAKRTVSGNATVGTEKVALTFTHMMSEVAFEITNSLGNGYNLEIKGGYSEESKLWLKTYHQGSYSFADEDWSLYQTWNGINFMPSPVTIPGNPGTGKENVYTTVSKFLFPTPKAYRLILYPWIRIEILQDNGGLADVMEINKYNTYGDGILIEGTVFEPGKKYLIKLDVTPESINAKEIEFMVETVNEYVDAAGPSIGANEKIVDDKIQNW